MQNSWQTLHFSNLPQSSGDIRQRVVVQLRLMKLVVLRALILVVHILERGAIVIGTQQQILLGNLDGMSSVLGSKQTLGESLETFRGALGVRMAELKSQINKYIYNIFFM